MKSHRAGVRNARVGGREETYDSACGLISGYIFVKHLKCTPHCTEHKQNRPSLKQLTGSETDSIDWETQNRVHIQSFVAAVFLISLSALPVVGTCAFPSAALAI